MTRQHRPHLSLDDAKMIWRGRDAYIWERQWATIKLGVAWMVSLTLTQWLVPQGWRLAGVVFLGTWVAIWGLWVGLGKGLAWSIEWMLGHLDGGRR